MERAVNQLDHLIALLNSQFQFIDQKLDIILDVLKDTNNQATTMKPDVRAVDSPTEKTAEEQKNPIKELESHDEQPEAVYLQEEIAMDYLATTYLNVRAFDFSLYNLPEELFNVSLEDMKGGKAGIIGISLCDFGMEENAMQIYYENPMSAEGTLPTISKDAT